MKQLKQNKHVCACVNNFDTACRFSEATFWRVAFANLASGQGPPSGTLGPWLHKTKKSKEL